MKDSHPFLIAFDIPTPWLFRIAFEPYPPSSFPNFCAITLFQKDSLLDGNLRNHLPRSALLRGEIPNTKAPILFIRANYGLIN